MKKIISLVCVIAMMLTFAVTVNAAGSSLDLVQTSLTADEAVYNVNLTTDYYTNGIGIYLDMSDAVAKGATVSVTKVAAGTARWVAAKKMVLITFAPTDGSTLEPGTTTLATIKFNMTNVTEAFAITKVAESTQTTTTFKHKTQDTFETFSYLDEIAYNYDVTVAPFAAGPVEQEVTGAAIACAKTWVAAKSAGSLNTNEYTNVAVATAKCEAGAKVAGFRFVKDDVNNTAGAPFVVLADADGIEGDGEIEYTAVMYGVEYDRVSTIYALPYYVIVK